MKALLLTSSDGPDAARAIAARIVRNSPLSLTVGKRLIHYGIDRRSIDYSVEAITVLQDSEDRREGVTASLKSARPVFKPANLA